MPITAGATLFIATLLLRGWQLGLPRTFVYDEVFYANDALDLVTRGVEQTRVGHPPLGKWLIGLGFAFSHFSPFTWRIASLIAGAMVVVLVFICTRRLTASTAMGVAAGALVLTDGVANAMGRYAFLDGFVSLFTTALLVVLLLTVRRHMSNRLALALGVLSGAALATKWSSLPVIAVVIVMIFERARRSSTIKHGVFAACLAVGAGGVAYVATYAPWIATGRTSGNCTSAPCHSNALRRVTLLPQMQRRMLESDANFPRQNFQLRPGWHWVYQRDAMQLFSQPCKGFGDDVCDRHSRSTILVAMRGNRVLWLAAWPVVLVWIVLRWKRKDHASGVGLAALWAAALWAPWIVRSKTFLYYAAPIVPALAIALVCGMYYVLPRRVAGFVIGVTVAAAAFSLVVTETAAPWRA